MNSTHLLQEYINSVYELNTNIIFTAPTGSGKSHFFNENIVNDLLKEKKICVIIVSHTIIQFGIMDNFEILIKEEDIFSKNTNSINFKNGSKIIIFTFQKEFNNLPNITCDILYLDSIGNLSNKYLVKIKPLIISKYHKLLITDSYESGVLSKIIDMLKYKPYYYKNITQMSDVILELRMLKIKKIKECIMI